MAGLTVGEPISGYKPVDRESAQTLAKKEGPSRIQKAGFKVAVASFLASLGLLAASTTGKSPIETTQEVSSTAMDAASHTQHELKDRVVGSKNNWFNGTPDPTADENK